ncbi:hypothetical protein L6654_37800 [Bradyrhizobium sp. WYCCWR 13023]|uniref:Uncharacterized protein n=1 Tax=Bradyrhizobium zhengyangense TaxID=2911009 RepID=A0A9X1UJV3_9BRAD|nr:hypothetical protein [Bradyrhizobium zhengyangense]MCG2632372.1 hypothetical protein [Bradyrhizobium zhengyangense]
MFRKLCILALFGAIASVPDHALAGGSHRYRPWAWHHPGLAVTWGWGNVYGYPLDDSFDPPFGYGEYAEYGPWADGGCFASVRRVATYHGWRWRREQ